MIRNNGEQRNFKAKNRGKKYDGMLELTEKKKGKREK